MADIDVIREMEERYGIKIPCLGEKTYRYHHPNSCRLTPEGNLLWISLGNFSIEDSEELISYLERFSVVTDLSLIEINGFDVSVLKRLKKIRHLLLFDLNVENKIEEFILQNRTHIESLDFDYCNLSDISFLSLLKKIKRLSITNSNIVDLTPLKGLKELNELSLNDNQISDISVLSHLKKLVYVNLSYNRIHNLSPLEKLTGIQELYLNGNLIDDVFSLHNLSEIKELSISSCAIEDLRPLQFLVNLIKLNLDDNSIESIAPLSNLWLLRELSLGNNFISDVSPLRNLQNLNVLILDRNAITDITPLQNLTNRIFEFLDLRNNKLKVLPEWIFNFKMDIEEYAEDIGISIGGNPFIDPPMEIIEQGHDAIRRYFERKRREGAKTIREGKLILVGDGSAGKTSLQKRLLDPKAELPARDTRTRGIEISDWEFKKGYIAHIWDFGGQDVYYPVHRFFLTEKSLFVLLASTRQEHHNFDYWIPTIYQFGGRSPVIIGQTCHDGNVVPWPDINDYFSNGTFNLIKTQDRPYYELNLKSRNRGLAAIRKEIISQLSGLPHCRKDVPASWVAVREALKKERKQEACISYDTFKRICREVAPGSFREAIDYSDCCEFFHHIGVLLWYASHKQLREYVILRPEWAMNAVYKIIDDPAIIDRKGHIQAADFTRLWKEKIYEDKEEVLKQMLQVFRVAFPKKHKSEDFLMPARLLAAPEARIWKDGEGLRIEYRFDFMPRGLLNQVSAELGRYIAINPGGEEEVWNNAVNFVYNDTHCQMEEKYFHKLITIRYKGKDGRGLLMLIEDTLKNTISQYKGVTYEIRVPCSCSACRSGQNTYYFKYDNLLRWLQEGRVRKHCNESDEPVEIEKLLYDSGFSSPPVPQPQAEGKQMKRISIFLASSFELEIDRKEFEIFINRENKELVDKNIFLHLEVWEDFLDRMGSEGIQAEYNKKVQAADIFVSLFFTKAGKYTREEFEVAYGRFITSGKPSVYVYIKDAPVQSGSLVEEDMQSLFEFKKQLQALHHFPTTYKNIDDLKYQFKKQLEKLLPELR
ncbi:MAG: hypothetical protein LUG98_13205 [Tannerellaceae bacterium]|nr:hypothetical protein [Tannerellaceae bacterium]